MQTNTIVLKGTGAGLKITLPATSEGRITIATKGKLNDLKVTPTTSIKFAA